MCVEANECMECVCVRVRIFVWMYGCSCICLLRLYVDRMDGTSESASNAQYMDVNGIRSAWYVVYL